MTHFSDGFDKHLDQAESLEDALFYDPTDPSLLKTISGCEIPDTVPFTFIEGARHATVEDLAPFFHMPAPGSLCLPACVPLLNRDSSQPLSRDAVYGVDLVLQTEQRSTHTMVFGVTGAGKNVTVLDNLRYSAIQDDCQSVISFSLKASDYGPISEMCEAAGKRLIVINLDDANRSLGWNPLETTNSDVAYDHIRRFADAMKNPRANETEFWNQWIKTAFMGAWQSGHKSFPAIYQFFSLPRKQQVDFLMRQNNSSARQLAEFINGGSHNADTVAASIVGALTPLLMENVQRVMGTDELRLDQVFEAPVFIHVEIRESRLETQKTLYQLLARAIIDELINTSERLGEKSLPATVFFDDMPSLGCLLSPQRLLTLRSREVGVVAGVQSLPSLELAYYETTRALVDNFNNKIVLPGGPAPDAAYFSTCTGENFVAVTNQYGDDTSYMSRPLLSAAAIRTPACSHPLLGKPATLLFGSVVFQAYLQKSYELPTVGRAIARGRAKTGGEVLRKTPLLTPEEAAEKAKCGIEKYAFGTSKFHAKFTSEQELSSKYEKVRKRIGWELVGKASQSARDWWVGLERSQNRRSMLELAENIEQFGGTIWTYFQASQDCPSNDRNAALHLMAYRLLCGSDLPPLKQMEFFELKEYGHESSREDESEEEYLPLFVDEAPEELYLDDFEDFTADFEDEPDEDGLDGEAGEPEQDLF